jgi:hypothetical protein
LKQKAIDEAKIRLERVRDAIKEFDREERTNQSVQTA